jgi:hypothetical protein
MGVHLRVCAGAVGAALTVVLPAASRAAVDIQYSFPNPGAFTSDELSILNVALTRSERMWETALTGYRPGISISSVPITINAVSSGLAAANYTATVSQGGFVVSSGGFININVNEIENFANWQGVGANGLNFVDELLAHETGHVLGVGTLWVSNGVYSFGTFQYTGAAGLAAYRAEFGVPGAAFVPVENAGAAGTHNSHWDQRMRSSVQEGNPSDPFSLDPRVGVVDSLGRDRGLEVLTGAIDPDYLEPWLSRTTVESMNDLGYTVATPYDFNHDGLADAADLAILTANLGATALQIDSIAFGDVDRDRDVDGVDLAQWNTAIPEPTSLPLLLLAAAAPLRGRRRR